mgnify:CR=1 FL=1
MALSLSSLPSATAARDIPDGSEGGQDAEGISAAEQLVLTSMACTALALLAAWIVGKGCYYLANRTRSTAHTKDVRPPTRPRKPQHKGVADLYDDHGTAPFDPPDDQHAPRTGAREARAAARAPLGHAYAPPPAVVRCAGAAMAPAAGCYYQGFNNDLNKNNNGIKNSGSYTPASAASSATSGELGEERTRAGDRCSSHLGFRPLFFCPGSAYFP